ncbi:MAG: tetratricopeptide repeat protein [Bacteroidia bacterium]
MRSYLKWIGLLSCFLSFNLNGQNIGSTFKMAQDFMESGNYAAAINTFERVVYFDTQNQYALNSSLLSARCYSALNETNKAIKAYNQALLHTNTDSLESEIALEKAQYLLQCSYWKKALRELYSIQPTSTDQEYLLNYLLGAALFANDDLVQSEFYFLEIAQTEAERLAIKAIFEKATKKLNPKRAKIAKWVSLIIPGSGQIAAGNFKSGINSILLLGGMGYIYTRTYKEYGVISGMITILPWFSRYHVGGSENAEESMLNRQEKLKSKYFNQLIDLVR